MRPRTVALALAASVLALFGGLWLALAWIDATFDRAPDPLESVPIAGVQRWGFNLDPLLVPRADLAASPARKDDIPALSDPEAVAASAADWIEADEHVIGVTLGGQSRAWPLRVLAWHRIVNDTLAGEPIAVTWHPLTASAAVFSRHVGGETLQFGVSGLLYKQNLVFFDRRADPNRESLWSQVRRQAIGGPAAGRRLDLIDCDLLPWAAWLRLHPDTTVLSPRTHYPIKYVGTWMYWPPPFIPPPDIVADQSVSRLPAAPAKQAERGRRARSGVACAGGGPRRAALDARLPVRRRPGGCKRPPRRNPVSAPEIARRRPRHRVANHRPVETLLPELGFVDRCGLRIWFMIHHSTCDLVRVRLAGGPLDLQGRLC